MQWNNATGAGEAYGILVSIADRCGAYTASTGSYLSDKSAAEVRAMFAHLLEEVQA